VGLSKLYITASERLEGSPGDAGYGGVLDPEGTNPNGPGDGLCEDRQVCPPCDVSARAGQASDESTSYGIRDKPEPECLKPRRTRSCRSEAQIPDPIQLPGLLRRGGERRGDEAARQGAEKRFRPLARSLGLWLNLAFVGVNLRRKASVCSRTAESSAGRARSNPHIPSRTFRVM